MDRLVGRGVNLRVEPGFMYCQQYRITDAVGEQ